MRKHFWQYFIVGLGGLISSIGLNTFLVPHHLLSGGISGIAMILYFLFNLPIGVMITIFNLPLLYAAYRFMDKEYLIVTVYGLLMFTFSIDATSFLSRLNVLDDTMLAAIYGGLLSGIGSGLIFRVNGSSGGLDIVAAIMKKYLALNMGFVNFGINCVIMSISALLFGLKPAMFTLVSMFISAMLTDKVIEGFNRKKTIYIISERSDEIAAGIINEIGRGVTFLQGEGAYTRQDKRVIFVVVTLTQIAKIKSIIEKIDRRAFMIIQDAAEVSGKGFTL
jgi:uncharacterized membrane-anchored protein YitT (DUF2179 family)